MRYTVSFVAFDENQDFVDFDVTFIKTLQDDLQTLMMLSEKAIAKKGLEEFSDIDEYACAFDIIITKDNKERIHAYSIKMKCNKGTVNYLETDNNEPIRWW